MDIIFIYSFSFSFLATNKSSNSTFNGMNNKNIYDKTKAYVPNCSGDNIRARTILINNAKKRWV